MKLLLAGLTLFGLARAQTFPNEGVVTTLAITTLDPVPLPVVGYSTPPKSCFAYGANTYSPGVKLEYEAPKPREAATSGGDSSYQILEDACYILPSAMAERPSIIFDLTQNFRVAGYEMGWESTQKGVLSQRWSDDLDLYDYQVLYMMEAQEGLVINVVQWGER